MILICWNACWPPAMASSAPARQKKSYVIETAVDEFSSVPLSVPSPMSRRAKLDHFEAHVIDAGDLERKELFKQLRQAARPSSSTTTYLEAFLEQIREKPSRHGTAEKS